MIWSKYHLTKVSELHMNVGLYGINYPIIAYYDAQVAMGQSSWLCGEGNIATNQQV